MRLALVQRKSCLRNHSGLVVRRRIVKLLLLVDLSLLVGVRLHFRFFLLLLAAQFLPQPLLNLLFLQIGLVQIFFHFLALFFFFSAEAVFLLLQQALLFLDISELAFLLLDFLGLFDELVGFHHWRLLLFLLFLFCHFLLLLLCRASLQGCLDFGTFLLGCFEVLNWLKVLLLGWAWLRVFLFSWGGHVDFWNVVRLINNSSASVALDCDLRSLVHDLTLFLQELVLLLLLLGSGRFLVIFDSFYQLDLLFFGGRFRRQLHRHNFRRLLSG